MPCPQVLRPPTKSSILYHAYFDPADEWEAASVVVEERPKRFSNSQPQYARPSLLDNLTPKADSTQWTADSKEQISDSNMRPASARSSISRLLTPTADGRQETADTADTIPQPSSPRLMSDSLLNEASDSQPSSPRRSLARLLSDRSSFQSAVDSEAGDEISIGEEISLLDSPGRKRVPLRLSLSAKTAPLRHVSIGGSIMPSPKRHVSFGGRYAILTRTTLTLFHHCAEKMLTPLKHFAYTNLAL
jgi:hypothetical protein